MSVQLTSQINLQALLTTLKNYKRNNDKLVHSINTSPQPTAQVSLLRQQSDSAAKQLQILIQRYEGSYLNPESAKKVMMIKQQFKTERSRMANQFSRRERRNSECDEKQAGEDQMEHQYQDYEVQNRLMREKGQSLLKVSENITKINEVMNQTHTLTTIQGEHLDLISDELDKSKNHLSKANQQLDEASKYDNQHSRKCMCLGLILLTIASVILILLLFFCLFSKLKGLSRKVTSYGKG